MARQGLIQRCGGISCPPGTCDHTDDPADATVQRSANVTAAVGGSGVPASVLRVLDTAGTPLDASTRTSMEERLGHDFGHVRVHTDAEAAHSAESIQAQAYTFGSHVVMGEGRFQPHTRAGARLLAHELTHVVQQSRSDFAAVRPSLAVGPVDAPEEHEADAAADAALRGGIVTVGPSAAAFVRRAAIYSGNISDEGSCEHLACNSKWACEDDDGVECRAGTRNAFDKTNKKFSPLFACDGTCDKRAEECSDSATWMALPHSRWTRGKCGHDLVICANSAFTHATVRDRSDKGVWEVSHGVQDNLAVSPYATFQGTVYGSENDAAFKTDARCGNAKKAKKADAGPDLAPDDDNNDTGYVSASDAVAASDTSPDLGQVTVT
jgi:hypothetical protein